MEHAISQNDKAYDFWSYSFHEALFLSEKEEATINNIIQNIQQEYYSNIDKFSKQIIISQIESLLSYAERFYNRQFITREKANHQILERLEKLLSDYINSNDLATKGLPTVQYISETLNISPNYLRSLLKVLTGQNTQQYIHEKLIEKAKENCPPPIYQSAKLLMNWALNIPSRSVTYSRKKRLFRLWNFGSRLTDKAPLQTSVGKIWQKIIFCRITIHCNFFPVINLNLLQMSNGNK